MSTANLTQPTTSTRSLRRVVIGSILLLAAITAVLVLTIGGVFAGTGGTSSGGGHGQDTSDCRPTSVAHYC